MTEEHKKRFAAALTRVGNDEGTLVMLAEIIATDAEQTLSEISSYAQDGDASSVATSAHKLKGMLSTFETDEPVSEIQQLIDAALADNAIAISSTLPALAPKLANLIGEIDAVAKSK